MPASGLGATWFLGAALLGEVDGQREGAGRPRSPLFGADRTTAAGGGVGPRLVGSHVESSTPRPAVSRGSRPNCPVLADLSLERVERATTNRPIVHCVASASRRPFPEQPSDAGARGRRDDDPRMRLAPRREPPKNSGAFSTTNRGMPVGAAEWRQAPGRSSASQTGPTPRSSSRAPSRMQRPFWLVAPLTRASSMQLRSTRTATRLPNAARPSSRRRAGATLAEHRSTLRTID